MARLRVEAQSTASRISAKAAAQPPAPTYDEGGRGRVANGELTDARDFNALWDRDAHATTRGVPFQDFDNVGDTLRGKPVFGLTGDFDGNPLNGDQNVRNQIDTGLTVAGYQDGIITWGFYDFRTKIGFNGNHEGKGYFQFTDAQKAVAYDSIAAWDELVSVQFQYQDFDEHDASQWAHGAAPDILFANTLSGPAQAWAYYPGGSGKNVFARIGSDVWIGEDVSNRVNLWDGGYGETTQIHELGHTLGLSHPGNYDFGDDNDGDGVADPITYVGDAFYFQDTLQYSIMSYFDAYEAGSSWIDWSVMRFMYSATPMVHDMWIIQQKYGADTTTRTGDSVYGFNSTSDVTNTAMKFTTTYEQAAVFSIWDAGGTDTLDLSGYHTPSVIDLREGAYSSAGGWNAYGTAPADDPSTMSKTDYLAHVNANNAALGMPARTSGLYDNYFTGTAATEGVSFLNVVGRDLLMENNIGIAYGAIIEDAKGGFGDDRINGNWATNHFWGNGGADVFVIADYDGTTMAGTLRTDTSVDVIEDFDRDQGDKIDVSALTHDAADVQIVGSDVYVDIGDETVHFVVHGDAVAAGDLFFGS